LAAGSAGAAGIGTALSQIVPCSSYEPVHAEEVFENLPDASHITSIDQALDALPRFTPRALLHPEMQIVLGIERLVRAKFYHGNSSYSYCENWIANLSGRIIWNDLAVKLDPDDILKHPWAGCNQQGIVVQELLKRSGIEFATVGRGEPEPHFASAARIDGQWYYVDSWGRLPRGRERLIPVQQIMSGEGLEMDFVGPKGAKFIRALKKGGTSLDRVNEFPGPRGLLFQTVTLWLSRFGWIVLTIAALALHYLGKRSAQQPEPAPPATA
jgi:hypothetical protein